MFVTRELLSHFTKQGGGILAFVERGGGHSDGGTLDKTITAAFTAFAGGLFNSQDAKTLIGFSAGLPPSGEQTDSFAAFILKLMTSGHKPDLARWHKFGKLNLFGR
jgi:hypothetical protein